MRALGVAFALAAGLAGCGSAQDGSAGTGGAPQPGTGGAIEGTGGAPEPGTGGTIVGTGGMTPPGTGGELGTGGQMGTGGATPPGTGGATPPGTGGMAIGTGGTTPGTGGMVVIGPSGLPTPPLPSGQPVPAGTPGNLTILNWAGWKGAVSYTFDDANSSQISNYAALNGMGVPLSFFLITGKTEASNAIWATALTNGHEVGNNTQSHAQIGTGADIDAATSFLKTKLGVTAYDMVAPYGDPSYIPLAQTRFFLNRGVSNGLVGPNDSTDPFNLFCYIAPASSLASAYNAQIDQARAAAKWRIVLVHGFTGGTDGAYQPVSIDEFTSSVGYTKSLGDMWIDTMLNVGAYWRGQKTVSAVVPVTSGGVTTSWTWTWTLPDHFPPGKYLRVKVDGGTLTQGGITLVWNDHGFYEISLDAGSLTLSP